MNPTLEDLALQEVAEALDRDLLEGKPVPDLAPQGLSFLEVDAEAEVEVEAEDDADADPDPDRRLDAAPLLEAPGLRLQTGRASGGGTSAARAASPFLPSQSARSLAPG